MTAGLSSQLLMTGQTRRPELVDEEARDVLSRFVNRGGNDVGRRFASKLNDVLSQIGLHRLDAASSNASLRAISSVVIDLLLTTIRAPYWWASPTIISRASFASPAQCTVPPVSANRLGELGKILIQPGEGSFFDLPRQVAKRVTLWVLGEGIVPALHDLESRLRQRVLKLLIGQSLPHIGREANRC